MARGFDAAKFNREMRAAQRKAEAAVKREVDRVNRENQRRVDVYNRKVDQHNKKVVADYNRQVDAGKRAVIADLNRQLRSASFGPRYTTNEQALADRVQNAIAQRDDREWDIFLSYARIDGAEIGDDCAGIWKRWTQAFGSMRSPLLRARAKRYKWIRGFRRHKQASFFSPRLISWGDSGPSVN